MSCTKPLKGFIIGKTLNNKDQYKITSYKVHHLEKHKGNWQPIFVNHIAPSAEGAISDWIPIPCGNCIGCRLDYAKQWSIRCMLEAQKYENNSFITLTYNDKHLPKSFVPKVNFETGETEMVREGNLQSLDKTDLQKFFKRIRKAGISIRYYASGEYGDISHRPHYHFIAFGYKPNDLRLFSNGKNKTYLSDEVQKFWCDENGEPIGNVIIGECSFESCAYVARYVMKKLKGFDSQYYDANGLEKEFVTMSRKPGIAREYYELHKDTDLFNLDKSYISTKDGSKSFKPFRYYQKLLEVDNPRKYEEYMEKNKYFSEEFKKLEDAACTKSYAEMLNDKDFVLNQKTNFKGRRAI